MCPRLQLDLGVGAYPPRLLSWTSRHGASPLSLASPNALGAPRPPALRSANRDRDWGCDQVRFLGARTFLGPVPSPVRGITFSVAPSTTGSDASSERMAASERRASLPYQAASQYAWLRRILIHVRRSRFTSGRINCSMSAALRTNFAVG